MKTNLHDCTEHPFVDDKWIWFSPHIDHQVMQRHHIGHVSIDLSLVRGTEHGDYIDSTWRQLLGDPRSGIRPRLKRIDRALYCLQRNPEYYLSDTLKDGWSFYLVDGFYYVQTGNHRTVIARYLLELNGRAPVVHGVAVEELILRRPEPLTEKPKASLFWRFLTGWLFD